MTHRALVVSTLALLATACPGRGGGSAPPVADVEDVAKEAPLFLNHSVDAIAVTTDGTAYVGGTFTAAGPFTGQVVILDPVTGAVAAPPPMLGGPHTWAQVRAAAADGRGGWYVGGAALGEGSGGRDPSLVRVRADGTVDPAFVSSFDGRVRTLAVGDGVVYVGGEFEHVGGAARHRIAAVDATTGAVTGWDPVLPPSVVVSALAVGSGAIYAGGGSAGAETASSWIAAVDPAGIVSSWHPTLDGSGVEALALRGRTLFAGGAFRKVDGQPRGGLAAFDPGGALSTWDGGASIVQALAVVGDTLYAGGYFGAVGGQPHTGIVAYDPSGAPSAWNPRLDGAVLSLAASDGILYVGGAFDHVGTTPRMNAAAFETSSGALLPWDPRANDRVQALAVSRGRVLAGGELTSVGAVSRRGLAAFDAQGRLTPWAPEVEDGSFPGVVRALTAVGDRLYVGGVFSSVGGVPRRNLAAIDRQGNVLDGTPEVSGTVYALAELAGAIYVGGGFDRVGGVSRRGLASFDPAAGGTVLAFDPGLASTYAKEPPVVYALSSTGSTLYAGGEFTRVGDAPRGNGAAFDGAGALLPWDPAATGPGLVLVPSSSYVLRPGIYALATSARGVYVGGTFSSVGGRIRTSAGLVDAVTGAASDWDPRIDNGLGAGWTVVRAILPQGDRVYLGGSFWTVGGAWRIDAACVDASTGAVARWDPGSSRVVALAADGNRILIGGAEGITAVAP